MVVQGDLAQQSLVQYRSTWRCHVRTRWQETPADMVRPIDVQQWLIGLSRVAAEASLHLMRQIMDYPTRYGLIPSNPLAIRYLLPSPTTTSHREDGVWSPQELGEVWRASWGTWFEPAVLLAGFGGCRVGEALGVRSDCVRHEDVNGVPITFVRIVRQIDSQAHEIERTKNKWSTRTTLLSGMPAQRLFELANDCPAKAYLTRPPHRVHATQRELRAAFAQRLEQCGVQVHLFKNLRKTWQTNMRWVLRLPPWVIEPMMGHVGEGITGKHYDKPSEMSFAQILADAWREHPFGDEYRWHERARQP
jgi:integrase